MERQPPDIHQISRREFLKQTGMMSAVTLFHGIHLKSVLRPPGASPEFLSKCIRCGNTGHSCETEVIVEKTKNTVKQKRNIRPVRRFTQTAIMALLIAVPLISQNPNIWSPSLAVQGYFPSASMSQISGDTWSFGVGDFRIMHPAAFLDVLSASKVLTFSLFISMLIPLSITFFLGRVFCSWMCPIGFILELTTKISKFIKKRVALPGVSLWDFRYVILVVSLLAGFVLACPVISIRKNGATLGSRDGFAMSVVGEDSTGGRSVKRIQRVKIY